MKFLELENVSGKRINITQVRGLKFEPGEVKKVHPETAKHPAVSRYIGSGLKLVTGELPKAEPKKAPAAPAPKKEEPAPAKDEQPIAPPVQDPPKEDSETDGQDLREFYISAPGITEGNVDDILAEYSDMDALKTASKDDLYALGVSKNQLKRLAAWIKDN